MIKPTSFLNSYDIANPNKMYIRGPELTLKPDNCFNVTDFEIFYKDETLIKPEFVKAAGNLLGFEVDT